MKRSLIPTKRMMVILAVLLVLHILVDLMRWQMIPVYLVVLFSLIGEYLNKTLQRNWLRAVVFSTGIVGVMLSALLCSVLPIFKLPPTSGAHTIGTELIDLAYGSEYREAKVWYPIHHQEDKVARYHPHPGRSLKGIMGMPGFVLSHLKIVKSNAYTVSQPSSDTTKYPLILYSHGAMSTLIDNTALLEDIASHGYVVVAMDHDFSFEQYGIDPEAAATIQVGAQTKLIDDLIQYVVPRQVKDCVTTLAQLIKHGDLPIDTTNIGLIGHSLGGTTALAASTQVSNASVAINLDGPVDTSLVHLLDTPLLYVSSFSPNLPDAELIKRDVPPAFYRGVKQYELEGVKRLFSSQSQDRSWVRFKGAGHLDLSDLPFIVPLLASKRYNKRSGHSNRADVIVDFLDIHTKDKPIPERKAHLSIEWLY